MTGISDIFQNNLKRGGCLPKQASFVVLLFSPHFTQPETEVSLLPMPHGLPHLSLFITAIFDRVGYIGATLGEQGYAGPAK